MASRFQGATLVASPSYPNSIAWSDDNLIAVASAHIVTIINPASPFGPRGLIRFSNTEPYPVGRVKSEDLLSDCLLPTALSRDRRPCVRSVAWSHLGMAPNYGCLLAVCTVEGRVKIYRPPYCDFSAEWIEVVDISDRLYDYYARINFGELDIASSVSSQEQSPLQGCGSNQLESCNKDFQRTKESKRRRVNVAVYINKELEDSGDKSAPRNWENANAGSSPDSARKGIGIPKAKSGRMKKNKPENCDLPLITPKQYASRSALLSSLVVAWSPVLRLPSKICSVPQKYSSSSFSILAVGGKSGKISFWRIHAPECYSVELSKVPTFAMLLGFLEAHSSWITTISLVLLGSQSNPQVLVASGSSDGSWAYPSPNTTNSLCTFWKERCNNLSS